MKHVLSFFVVACLLQECGTGYCITCFQLLRWGVGLACWLERSANKREAYGSTPCGTTCQYSCILLLLARNDITKTIIEKGLVPSYNLAACETKLLLLIRHRGDSNPCGQSPMDFESISLAARTQCHVDKCCKQNPVLIHASLRWQDSVLGCADIILEAVAGVHIGVCLNLVPL